MANSKSPRRFQRAHPKRASGPWLGRALFPESDFDLLSGVARGLVEPAPVNAPPAKDKDDEKGKGKGKQQKIKSVNASDNLSDEGTPVAVNAHTGEVRYLDLSQIEANPFQPRQVWNEAELEDLANSIREHGVLQPVLFDRFPI